MIHPVIRFRVLGLPKAQPRARAFSLKGKGCRMYDPGTAEAWKSDVAMAVKPHLPSFPLTGPVRLDLDFFFPRPKCHYRTGKNATELRPDAPKYWHAIKPDRDNGEKAVLDCLTRLCMWADDCQVCCGEVRKFWANSHKGVPAGAKITITELDPQTLVDFDI